MLPPIQLGTLFACEGKSYQRWEFLYSLSRLWLSCEANICEKRGHWVLRVNFVSSFLIIFDRFNSPRAHMDHNHVPDFSKPCWILLMLRLRKYVSHSLIFWENTFLIWQPTLLTWPYADFIFWAGVNHFRCSNRQTMFSSIKLCCIRDSYDERIWLWICCLVNAGLVPHLVHHCCGWKGKCFHTAGRVALFSF